jgi:chemotaxis protein methyltransferase WspC
MTSATDPALAAAADAAGAELAAFAGLDVAALGARAVERAVRERVRASGLTADAWAARLAADADERAALVDAVVVPETMLFRDGSPFEALRGMAAARAEAVATRRPGPGEPLRVLSAACSTGEEAYSAAIALLAGGVAPGAARVVALDLSGAALAVAATGVLPRTALRGAIPDWAEPYLDRRPDGSVGIAAPARDLVELRPGNVLDAPDAGHCDAVLCRNLLIYLTAPARARAAAWLASQLAPGAPLFVGHAEVAALLDLGWRRAPEHGPYALVPAPVVVRAGAAASDWSRPAPVSVSPPVASSPAAAAPPTSAPSGPSSQAPAAAAPPPDDPGALAQATRLAESGDRDGAIAVLTECVTDDPADVEAHALLGILHATAGRSAAARDALRRALYLDPDHAESRAQLALLDRSGGGPRP